MKRPDTLQVTVNHPFGRENQTPGYPTVPTGAYWCFLVPTDAYRHLPTSACCADYLDYRYYGSPVATGIGLEFSLLNRQFYILVARTVYAMGFGKTNK